MTSKKRRQRGSRTHSGGTHKNRRGAGHRGGRGNAGRDKHEYHNHEPLGKNGFKRPQKVQREVVEIDVRELDEEATLLAADDLAEVRDGAFHIDVRDVVDDGHNVDEVKVLGGGQVRNELVVMADNFSKGAKEKIEDAGGSIKVPETGGLSQTDDASETGDEQEE